MRNGHHNNHNQNKRMRGRNNRRGHNPLTRVYESNGPDVKIRGTAHHIAEKYVQLARDAQSSGDPVSAEGYLQHAEHYFRMIAAAQQQFAQQNPNQPQQPFQRSDMDGQDSDEDGDESGGAEQQGGQQPFQGQQGGHQHSGNQHQPRPQPQNQPQPNFGGYPQNEQNDTGLPAFITGGGAPQQNGHDHEQGDNRRFDRNRNRGRNFRPRNDRNFEQREPREQQQGGDAPQPQTDAPKQSGE
jgi:hypothetical protein